jgi:hypothetical protein
MASLSCTRLPACASRIVLGFGTCVRPSGPPILMGSSVNSPAGPVIVQTNVLSAGCRASIASRESKERVLRV